ncbi:MAG: cell division protein SepF [Eubacterium sp.]|nr:cell division protein SepF [Eubacterium sp.]MBR0119895.1 cell division protein SepF [Eubacterium sp.]
MALNSILNFFRIEDDEGYEDDDGMYADEEETKQERPVSRKSFQAVKNDETDDEESTGRRSGFLGSKSKVVPMKPAMQVNIISPTSFEDSQEICNKLLSGRPVVVNLEGFDPDNAQRIMDFISGCIYAINGKYNQIAKYIFIFSPENVDISSDSISINENTVSMMPTIDREF